MSGPARTPSISSTAISLLRHPRRTRAPFTLVVRRENPACLLGFPRGRRKDVMRVVVAALLCGIAGGLLAAAAAGALPRPRCAPRAPTRHRRRSRAAPFGRADAVVAHQRSQARGARARRGARSLRSSAGALVGIVLWMVRQNAGLAEFDLGAGAVGRAPRDGHVDRRAADDEPVGWDGRVDRDRGARRRSRSGRRYPLDATSSRSSRS